MTAMLSFGSNNMLKICKLFSCFLVAGVFAVGFFLYGIYERERYQCQNFNIISFFHDYNVPLNTNTILYSDILSHKGRHIVLAEFSLAQDSMKAFLGALGKSNQNPNVCNFQEKKNENECDWSSRNITNHYRLSDHVVYLYDIRKNDHDGNVNVKCLIALSL